MTGNRRLGTSKVQVNRLGMGGTALGGLYKDISEATATATVQCALKLGVNFFDTAPLYGSGKSESRLGNALAGRDRDSFVIATKVGYMLVPHNPGADKNIFFPFENAPPFRPTFDFSYDATMRSLEQSYKRLGVNRIDLVHIHDPDENYAGSMSGAYVALTELRRNGVIRAISVGMNQSEMLVRFAQEGEFDCFLLAGRYTLLDQSALTELLPLCAEKGISIIIGGPYNSGILATGASQGAKFNYVDASPALIDKVRRIESVCSRYAVPLKAAALQFPLGHPAVASVIPGARTPEEMEENVQLINHTIPSDLWEELRQENLLLPEAPAP